MEFAIDELTGSYWIQCAPMPKGYSGGDNSQSRIPPTSSSLRENHDVHLVQVIVCEGKG